MAAVIHPADQGDTTTIEGTLRAAEAGSTPLTVPRPPPLRPSWSPTKGITAELS